MKKKIPINPTLLVILGHPPPVSFKRVGVLSHLKVSHMDSEWLEKHVFPLNP